MKSELKKSINIYLLIFLLCVGVLVVLSSMYENLAPYMNVLSGDDVQAMTQVDKDSLLNFAAPHKNIYIAWLYGTRGYEIICVAIATCAYAFTYVIEKKSGMIKNILLRTKIKTYFIVKATINFVIGGLIASIPLVILFIVCIFSFSDRGVPSQEIAEIFPTNVMSEYFGTNSIIYVIFFVLIVFLIGGVYSTMAMAIGAITNNIIAAIILPNLYWFFGSLLVVNIGIGIQPWDIYYFNTAPEISFVLALLNTILVLGISLYIIYRDCKKQKLL